MVSSLKTKEGYVYAYAEWRIVNEDGVETSTGDFLHIQNVWIHPEHRALKELIKEIDSHPNTMTAIFVYWRNQKRDRLTKPFLRCRFKGVTKC